MKDHTDTRSKEGIEKIMSFLNKYGVESQLINKDKYGFSRVIEFFIYGVRYKIVWAINQSSLYIGEEHKRQPFIPFVYLYHDNTFPLVKGNTSLGFASKTPNKEMFASTFEYNSFRIPLEIK